MIGVWNIKQTYFSVYFCSRFVLWNLFLPSLCLELDEAFAWWINDSGTGRLPIQPVMGNPRYLSDVHMCGHVVGRSAGISSALYIVALERRFFHTML